MRRTLKNFFVIEGLDGAGTTTQLKRVSETLEKNGKTVFRTFEPTDLETGLIIRRILRKEFSVTPYSLALLYAADRENHINGPVNGIAERTARGEIVISDRYFFSSFAYQGIDCDFGTIMQINSAFPYPEAVIYIDTPVEECMRRIGTRKTDAELFEKEATLKKVRENYEKSFAILEDEINLIRINGLLSPAEIEAEILKAII